MTEWISDNRGVLLALSVGSLIVFVGSLVLAPIVIVRIPADYFAHRVRPHSSMADAHPVIRGLILVVKNALGAVLVLAGLAMLLTPGQGLLTLLAGFFLVDFPGKYRLERWLVGRPRVLRGLNWIRRRTEHAPLVTAPSTSRTNAIENATHQRG